MQQSKLSVCYTVKRNTGRQGVACALASDTRMIIIIIVIIIIIIIIIIIMVAVKLSVCTVL